MSVSNREAAKPRRRSWSLTTRTSMRAGSVDMLHVTTNTRDNRRIHFPDGLDEESTAKIVLVNNSSLVKIGFKLETNVPLDFFKAEPSEGILDCHQSMESVLTLKPHPREKGGSSYPRYKIIAVSIVMDRHESEPQEIFDSAETWKKTMIETLAFTYAKGYYDTDGKFDEKSEAQRLEEEELRQKENLITDDMKYCQMESAKKSLGFFQLLLLSIVFGFVFCFGFILAIFILMNSFTIIFFSIWWTIIQRCFGRR